MEHQLSSSKLQMVHETHPTPRLTWQHCVLLKSVVLMHANSLTARWKVQQTGLLYLKTVVFIHVCFLLVLSGYFENGMHLNGIVPSLFAKNVLPTVYYVCKLKFLFTSDGVVFTYRCFHDNLLIVLLCNICKQLFWQLRLTNSTWPKSIFCELVKLYVI